MEIEPHQKPEPERKNFPLWLGFGISAAWILVFSVYWFRNFAEIWALAPNNLGDFLAGVFAPLAFLWLFVATLLQRQELELQREELAETRQVLAQQKEEMKRAADENSQQTKIMTENLVAEAGHKLYEQIDIRLYSLALYVWANHSISVVDLGNPRRGHAYIMNLASSLATDIDRNNSDKTYLLMLNSALSFSSDMGKYNAFSPHPKAKAFFDYVHSELSYIARTKAHFENQQVSARLKGLQIPQMLDLLDQIGNKVFEGK